MRFASTFALLLVCSLPGLAAAQTAQPAQPAPAAASSGGGYHGDYEIGVNFFDRVRNRGVTTTYSPGWYAGASYRVMSVISVVGEIAADYKNPLHAYTFSGGARFQSGSKAARARPFAQVLMGAGADNGGIGQSPTHNRFPVVTPGGGVDVRLGPHVAARVKLDFPIFATFGDAHKGFRFSLGASIPLGTK
ncbi:MAG: hypothetical protein ACRD1V_18405 [Vicinamibacterales bacterium]